MTFLSVSLLQFINVLIKDQLWVWPWTSQSQTNRAELVGLHQTARVIRESEDDEKMWLFTAYIYTVCYMTLKTYTYNKTDMG